MQNNICKQKSPLRSERVSKSTKHAHLLTWGETYDKNVPVTGQQHWEEDIAVTICNLPWQEEAIVGQEVKPTQQK